ncbi:MAG: acetyl-CoA carboxylase biotin carboxyl carrier protein [Saprospiraceae bacterium]|nr:acetyl-CoA carboxylase biotin carboxyl carrier protein [Saprospiraceae bacterium]
MDLKEIQELIRMMGKSNLAELKLKQGDFELILRSELSKEKMAYVAAPVSAPTMAPVPLASVPAAATAEKKESAVPTAETPKPANDKKLLEIKSPMVGTFYRSSSPDKPPYVKVGDTVTVGQVVCMVEAMKLFNEIESEISGTIVKIVADDASPVEYDQVLFLVEP